METGEPSRIPLLYAGMGEAEKEFALVISKARPLPRRLAAGRLPRRLVDRAAGGVKMLVKAIRMGTASIHRAAARRLLVAGPRGACVPTCAPPWLSPAAAARRRPPVAGEGRASSASSPLGERVKAAQGQTGSARARLALGASGLAGVLLWMGHSRSGAASMEEGTPDERQLSAVEAAAVIRERLNQISPAVAASVLPWQCIAAENGRVSLRFEVKPHSDHFQTLMVALLEMETSAQDGDAGRHSVNAVLSAWDDEADRHPRANASGR